MQYPLGLQWSSAIAVSVFHPSFIQPSLTYSQASLLGVHELPDPKGVGRAGLPSPIRDGNGPS